MKLKITVLTAITAILIGACNKTLSLTAEQQKEALSLLESNCYTCHTPKGGMSERLAPPMMAVKKHYINESTSLATFTTELIDYVNAPSEEKSKMPGARRKFGLMPAYPLDDDKLKLIAQYIFETDLESPKWFKEHYKKEKQHRKSGKETTGLTLEKGKDIALSTKAALGSNLLSVLNDKGAAGAVDFCNTRALPTTDSLALVHNVSIKRVSDKARNPLNQASELELEYIAEVKEMLSNGKKPKPRFNETDKTAYYPILTNEMCIQCHGKKTDLLPETLKVLAVKYPNDKATGYSTNELRGIWVISDLVD